MESMKLQGSTITLEDARASLEHHRTLLAQLNNREVTPSRIVGKGYTNPRKVAEQYINQYIGRYEIIVAVMEEA